MSAVDWDAKPEPWCSIGKQFVRSLSSLDPLVPVERKPAAVVAAELVRDFRCGKGWAQKTLAFYAKCNWTTVNRIENGRTFMPTAKIRKAIAQALGVAVEDIWA